MCIISMLYMQYVQFTVCCCLIGKGHLEARSDGGDCHVDTTKAAGTEKLKSTPNFGLALKLGSHQPTD